jgi:hypothetical protein
MMLSYDRLDRPKILVVLCVCYRRPRYFDVPSIIN